MYYFELSIDKFRDGHLLMINSPSVLTVDLFG